VKEISMKEFGLVLLILSSMLMLTLANQDGFAADESLVLYLPFDEGSGNIAKDFSGKGNNGKIMGAEWVDGKIGKALKFDGSSYVDIEHSDSLSLEVDITVMAWVLAESGQTAELMIISKGQWAANDLPYELSIYPPSGVIYWQFYDTAGRDGCDPVAPTYDEWHHIAATYDGDVFKCYVDGVLAKEYAYKGVLPQNDANVTIGRRSKVEEAYFVGLIDEVALFNRVLDIDEILKDMEGMEAPVNSIEKLPTVWGAIK
jgi:hypothetical protein